MLRRGRRLLGRCPADGWALLAVITVVLLANAPYLSGWLDARPLDTFSSLASSTVAGPVHAQWTIDPNAGYTSQALGHRAALDLLHLHLPWWNPYEATGAPLAGEIQSAALFPPTLLTALSDGQLYEHVLLELIAGIAAFLLLRRLAINRWASIAGAIAFALNGAFAWFAHAPVNPIALLPLLLLGIEHAHAASVAGRRGGWWLIALAGALSFYAGFPEVAYIDTLLAICWFAWRCGALGAGRLALLRKGAAGALAGTLLSGPLLIAMIGYLNEGFVGAHGASTLGDVHLPAQQLPQLLLPYVYGPIFGFAGRHGELTGIWGSIGGYLSTSLLLFALLGLLGRRHRWLRLVLCGWSVLVLARIYGEPPLLGHVFGLLPGMNRVAFFRYANPSLALAVIALAALGIDDLARAAVSRRRLLGAAAATLLVVGVAAIGSRSLIDELEPAFHQHRYFQYAVLWGVSIVIAAAVVALLRNRRLRSTLLSVLLVADAVALFAAAGLAAPRSVKLDHTPVDFLQGHLGQQRFFTLGPLQPNYGSYFGVGSLNVNDNPIPSLFKLYVHNRLDQVVDPHLLVGDYGGARPLNAPSPQSELIRNLQGYRAAAVTYVLTPAGQRLPQGPTAFALVLRTPTTWIYRLAGAAPYFSSTSPTCRVSATTRTNARVDCAAATVLIRRETELPGWSAEVDGHAAHIERAEDLFQAVSLPAGSHRLSFSYEPPGALWGLVALLAGLSWTVLGVRRRALPRPI